MKLSLKSWLMLVLVMGLSESFVVHRPSRPLHPRPSASSSSRRLLAPVDIHTLTGAVQTVLYPLASSFQSHVPVAKLRFIAEALQQVSTTHLRVPAWLTVGWESYSTLLREQPVATKATTAAILCFTGDAVAQARTTSEEPYDIRRGLAFLAFGAMYTGLFQHHWFSFLQQHVADWGENIHIWGHPAETNIPVSYFMQQTEWWEYFDIKREISVVMETLQDPPSPAELAMAKVAVNQFIVIPSIYMPLFFVVTGLVAGLDFNKIVARAQSLYLPLLQRNYMFWIPTQFAQFLLIPVDYQVPFVCVASLCWTIILSSIGGSSAQPASPSTIVAYEQQEAELGDSSQEPVVTVMAVDAGPVNELTDEVFAQDVRDRLVPESIRDAVERVSEDVKDVLAIPQVGASASGLAFGLLASATDEATIGAAVGAALGIDESVGVAVVAAVGAGAGYLAKAISDDRKEDELVLREEQFEHEFHSSHNATAPLYDAFVDWEAQKGR